jgi:hypothetical protein
MTLMVTAPRCIEAGDSVMAQKKCYRGEFRLRPERLVVQAILYCLGVALLRYPVRLHDFSVVSNHDHEAMTDPLGVRSLFLQVFHSLVARSVNCKFKERDSLWSGQRHCAVKLLDRPSLIDRCIYALLNPVHHLLVRYVWEWTGPTSWKMEYGVPIKIKKPPFFFSKKMPDEVEIVIHRPEGLFPELVDDRQARAKLRQLALEKQANMIVEAKREGRRFLGMGRVMRQLRSSTPSRPKPLGGLIPQVAANDEATRIEGVKALKQFQDDYRIALAEYCDGDREVEFPPGTYLMHRRFGVRIRPPP